MKEKEKTMRRFWFLFSFLFIAGSSGMILGQDASLGDGSTVDPGDDPPGGHEEEIEDPPEHEEWPDLPGDEGVGHDYEQNQGTGCKLCLWFSVDNTPTVINPANDIVSWFEAHIHSVETNGLPGTVYLWVNFAEILFAKTSFSMDLGGPMANENRWANIQNVEQKRYNFRIKKTGTLQGGDPYTFEDTFTEWGSFAIYIKVKCVHGWSHQKHWRVYRL
jgi:hypothetical protein